MCLKHTSRKATYKNARIQKELIFQKVLMLIRQIYQKNVIFAIISILKALVLNMNPIFAMVVMV